MKKERNCGYPQMPVYPMPGPMPVGPMNPGVPYYSQEPNNMAKMQDEIMNLEKRVTRLEGIVSGNQLQPNYQESNFYMV